MATEHLHNPSLTDDMRGATDVEGWQRAFQRNLFNAYPVGSAANNIW
jgi:hypothetical protein